MSTCPNFAVRLLAGAFVIAAATACGRNSETMEPVAREDHGDPAFAVHAAEPSPAVREWLAQLRRRTRPFQKIKAAAELGWGTKITECMVQEGSGGMGFHYGNTSLIDAVVEPLAPEVLVYEPQRNGKMRFVAVEYVVPFTAWTSSEPPEVHGVPLHRNEAFQLWVLHVWIGKHNPTGIFMDWNPEVSCRFAPKE
jgi:hypothetical protein